MILSRPRLQAILLRPIPLYNETDSIMPKIIHVKSAHRPRAGKSYQQCEECGKEILPRMPYKHVTVMTGPRSSHKRVRCNDCPTWQPWDLSNALWARLAQITHEFSNELSSCEDEDSIRDLLNITAEAVREIAEEKRESASNIEDGFGHPTSLSEELEGVADELETWADEIENADIPEYPEPEETECDDCTGSGDDESLPDQVCETCKGEGNYTSEEPTEEQVEGWLGEVADSLSDVVGNSPV